VATLLIAGLSGVIALASAAIAIWGQIRSTRLAADLERLRIAKREHAESEQNISRYREPLARAAYDLQSRLYNIVNQSLIAVYFDRGDERTRHYVTNNTVFLIAQYFAWIEISRREIRFFDLGEDEQTRELARLQDRIHRLWNSDHAFGPLLRVFAGEQRAIGEAMLVELSDGLDCIGYGAYLEKIQNQPDTLHEFLRLNVVCLSDQLKEARPRMVAVQNALIDLLAFLDPQFLRFPAERRLKSKARQDY
jgi:virulence-associated protein VapD